MATVNLSELKPGMRLAGPVFNLHGNLLLNKGVELTERHISILRAWGVTQANVEGMEEETEYPGLQGLDDQALISIDKELKDRFSDVLKDEVMMEIMRVAKKQIAKKMATTLMKDQGR